MGQKRIKPFALIIVFAVISLAVAGCSSSSGEELSVNGNVTYLQRAALPEDAQVHVEISDLDSDDYPNSIIGETTVATNGQQVPIAFVLPYNTSDIEAVHDYVIAAQITDAQGNLLYISETPVPVITKGNPTTDVEILVEPTNGG